MGLSKNQIIKLHIYIYIYLFILITCFTLFFHVTKQAWVLSVLDKSFYLSLEEIDVVLLYA